MSSNKWDVLPLDEDTKKLGKISRVRINDSTMEIYNGKTKPITFSYNESTSEDLYKAFVDIGYTDQLASRICTRLFNALDEYTKKQAQDQYESEHTNCPIKTVAVSVRVCTTQTTLTLTECLFNCYYWDARPRKCFYSENRNRNTQTVTEGRDIQQRSLEQQVIMTPSSHGHAVGGIML